MAEKPKRTTGNRMARKAKPKSEATRFPTNKLTYKVILSDGNGHSIVERTGRSVLFEIDNVKIGMAIQDADEDGNQYLVHVASGLIVGQALNRVVANSITDAATTVFDLARNKAGKEKMLSVIRGAKVLNPPPKGRI